jgi:hypothetical protein
VRRLAAIVLAVAVLAGCGSGKKTQADPGRDVLAGFFQAAGRGDRQAMESLLSPQTRTRLHAAALTALGKRLRPFARGYRLLVSERITDEFGLAAATNRGVAFGAALRLVDGRWLLELAGPVRIRPLGPRPGARQRSIRQLAAGIDGTTGGGEALLYFDGLAIPDAKVYRYKQQLSIVANLPTAVPKGRHSVIVFAGSSTSARARAWTFVVPG